MDKEVLKAIKKYLYDIDSTLEIVRDDFLKNNIDIDKFLKIVNYYITYFSTLEKSEEENLLELLNVKLYEILTKYNNLDIPNYVTQIKANINFIEKHKNTFFSQSEYNNGNNYITSDSSATIKIIHIENFFSIKNIYLKNLDDKKEIYIVGENGDGKTLFLQALTIALVGVVEGPLFDLTKKQSKFYFNVENSDNTQYASNSIRGVLYDNLLAYGTSRNNYCQLKEDTQGYLTLFSGEYDLKSSEEWLIGLYNAQNANETLLVSLDEAIKLLQQLLNKDITIDVSYKKVIFKERGSEVSFSQLSAGYKGVITIICDMIERFSEKQNVKNIKDFKGIVLIDEVELHLHPKWQYTFMNKLRSIFPHIQFIVTTHSPTVILGASNEAIYYKIFKDKGLVNISKAIKVKNDFLNDIQSDIFGFDINKERIKNPDIEKHTKAKENLSKLIQAIKDSD